MAELAEKPRSTKRVAHLVAQRAGRGWAAPGARAVKAARMPFGRFKGALLRELPDSYLCWLRDDSELRQPLRMRVEREYQRRIQPRSRTREAPAAPLALPSALSATALEIVITGFRTLALKRHPDHGGGHEEMLDLQRAREALEGLLGTARGRGRRGAA